MSLGLVLAGPPGAIVGGLGAWAHARRRGSSGPPPEIRLVLMLLLVELRSGSSVLAALQSAAARLPGYSAIRRVARVATVSGLVAAISVSDESLRPVVAQLARSQRSGSSLASTVMAMIEQDLARSRAEKLTRARTLPVRLMIPVTLLMLPGLLLLLYAPALIQTFDQLIRSWS